MFKNGKNKLISLIRENKNTETRCLPQLFTLSTAFFFCIIWWNMSQSPVVSSHSEFRFIVSPDLLISFYIFTFFLSFKKIKEKELFAFTSICVQMDTYSSTNTLYTPTPPEYHLFSCLELPTLKLFSGSSLTFVWHFFQILF